MKKMKLLFLLGLISSAFCFSPKANSKVTIAEEEKPITLEFEEVPCAVMDEVVYRCITPDFYPTKITEHFRAPKGSVFVLDAVENKIDTVVSYLKDVVYSDGATDVKYFTIAINRKINDVEMYGDLTVEHDNFNLTRTKDVLIENLSDLILYEVEERISEFDLGCEVTISITPDIDEGLTYSFIFQSEICHVKPFQDSDIIKVFTQYYYAEALEARATVRFELNDDIFNERFGFRTEDPTGEFDDVDGPFYSIAYIDKVTNIILDTSKNSNLEIHSIPKDPMIIFVRLSFVSYGKQYTFFSNEAVIQEKMPNALLDGYKNRTVIGLNDGGQHFLEFQTKFALDDVATFAIGPYYYEGDEIVYLGLHVYDPTYDPDAELNKNDNGENDEENNKKGEDDDDDEKPDVEIEYFATLSNEFFRFNLNFDKVGEYTIYCNFAYETNDSVENYSSRNYWNQTIKVEEGVVAKTLDPEEAFSLDVKVGNNKSNALVNEYSSSIICTAGGSPIELSTSIPEELIAQGEKIKFNVDLDNVGNCIAVNVSDDGNKIIINPTSEGSTSLTLSVEITGLGIVEKVINFKVYGDISNYSEILVNDEFHYSNTDLEVKFNLKTEEKICNVKIQWEVLDSDGSPAEFTVSDDMMSIILVNPKQDDYTITALQNGFKLCSQSVQIRDFNIDKFVQNNIWWMFIIALALLAGVVAIKIFLTRNNTIIDQISGACQLVEKIDLSSKNVNRDFFKLKLMLQKEIRYSRDLNIDGMNQYEKTIRYLNKSLEDAKHFDKNKVLSDSDKEYYFEQLKKDLNKALVVVTDIQAARSLAQENSMKANVSNFAKVENEKKNKKK